MNKKSFLGSVCAALALAAVVSSCGDGKTRSTGMEFSRNKYDPIAYNPDQPNNNFKNKTTIYNITPLKKEVLEKANNIAKSLIDNKITLSKVNYNNVKVVFGKGLAEKIIMDRNTREGGVISA